MIIEDLLVELEGGGPEAEQLAEVLGQQIYFAQRNTGITDAQHRVQQTWLVGEVPVTLDENGDGRDPIGDAYFDRINLASGLSATVNADEPRQIDITAAGGTGSGADCMYDYLVSTCFATLAGFTEGEVFTSISGCTFKGYSTVGGMVNQAFIDFGASNVSVAYICRGTYGETNINFGLNQYMRWYGSGRTRTIIGPTTLSSTNTVNLPTGARIQMTSLTLRASTNSSSTAGGIDVGGSGWLIAEDCVFRGLGVTTLDATTWAILGGGTAFVFLNDCELQRNGFLGNNESVAQFTHCVHTGGGVGIRALNNTQITGCFFNTSLVGASQLRSNCQVTGCHFEDCTTGITSVSGSTDWLTVSDNHYDNCTTAMDFSDGGTTQNYNWKITDNHGVNMGVADVFIAWPSTASNIYGVCYGNMTDGAGIFSSGVAPVGMRIGPNYEENGLARGDFIGSGLAGLVQNGVQADFKTVRWGSFVVFFGSTKTVAVPNSFTYPNAANTYYISMASTGIVTANNTGGFAAGEFPLAIAITNIVGRIIGFEWYDGYLRTTSSGAAPAPADASYVTMALSAGLSAERVLTAGAGITITDAGPNSTVTIASTAATSVIKQMYISFGEIPGVPYSA